MSLEAPQVNLRARLRAKLQEALFGRAWSRCDTGNAEAVLPLTLH